MENIGYSIIVAGSVDGGNHPHKIQPAKGSYTMKKYQICTVNKEKRTAAILETVDAEALKDAVEMAGKYPRTTTRVYPLVTLDNPETIVEMARFTLASVENWERRNNYAVMNPAKRNQCDREDYSSIATVAILDTLTENPAATMYEVKSAAFSAIRAYQQRQDRNSEKEYMPGWSGCNVVPRLPRSTFPALDRLVKKAIDEAAPTLSPVQVEVFTMSYVEDMDASDIAERTGKARQNVYKNLARAYYWVLSKALEMDKNGDIFSGAGYTQEDIAETLATLRKRGGMNKNQK